MLILKWIKTFRRASHDAVTQDTNYQALAHLDHHLLRDIGFYRDHSGEVRSLTGRPSHGVERVAHEYCPYCRSPLI